MSKQNTSESMDFFEALNKLYESALSDEEFERIDAIMDEVDGVADQVYDIVVGLENNELVDSVDLFDGDDAAPDDDEYYRTICINLDEDRASSRNFKKVFDAASDMLKDFKPSVEGVKVEVDAEMEPDMVQVFVSKSV